MATTEGESSGKEFTHPNKTIFTHNKYTLIFFSVLEVLDKKLQYKLIGVLS